MGLLLLFEEIEHAKNLALSVLLFPHQNCLPLAFSSCGDLVRAPSVNLGLKINKQIKQLKKNATLTSIGRAPAARELP